MGETKKRSLAEEIADLWQIDARDWPDDALYGWMAFKGYVWQDDDWYVGERTKAEVTHG